MSQKASPKVLCDWTNDYEFIVNCIAASEMDSNYVVRITGFDANVEPDEVEECVLGCGPILHITLLYDRTRPALCTEALVEFEDSISVAAALEMSGTSFNGCVIHVSCVDAEYAQTRGVPLAADDEESSGPLGVHSAVSTNRVQRAVTGKAMSRRMIDCPLTDTRNPTGEFDSFFRAVFDASTRQSRGSAMTEGGCKSKVSPEVLDGSLLSSVKAARWNLAQPSAKTKPASPKGRRGNLDMTVSQDVMVDTSTVLKGAKR